MDKRQIFVLLSILAGAFIAADGAPQHELVSDTLEVPQPELGTDPELYEAEVGTADGTIDPIDLPFLADVSSGLITAQVPESDQPIEVVADAEDEVKADAEEEVKADAEEELKAGAESESGSTGVNSVLESGPTKDDTIGVAEKVVKADAESEHTGSEGGPEEITTEEVVEGEPEFESTEMESQSKEFEAEPGPMGSIGRPDAMAAVPHKFDGAQVIVEKILYKWTIINYNHHDMGFGEALYSPVFSGESTEDYRWQLQYYPRGNEMKYNIFASLYLASVGKNGANPIVQFSIIDKNGKNVNIKKFKGQKFAGKSWGFGNFVPFSTLEKGYHKIWVPDDRLTLLVEITFSPGIKESTHCTDYSAINCLAMPYDNHYNNDVYLYTADQQTVTAHKAILAGHSTWFAEQIQQNLHTNTIMLPSDVKIDELKEIVKFIHTGKVNPSMVERLKALADQLGMNKLKIFCEEASCLADYD